MVSYYEKEVVKIMFVFDNINQILVPELLPGQCYIYVLLNAPQGGIKIGRSCHIQQRVQSLSGSNGGGNRIVRCAVSEPTYLYTLERVLHSCFSRYRVPGSEWFTGRDLSFEQVVSFVDTLFVSSEYIRCNQVRREFVAKHGLMYGKPDDRPEKECSVL